MTPPVRSALRGLALAALLPAVAAAQAAPVKLLIEGDNIAGVGNVTRIDNLIVNSSGQWIVEADTDHANTNADQVLVKNGALFLREWQALSAPVGASINSFDAVTLSATGRSGWNLFLAGPPGNEDSGIYFDDVLVIQESDVSTATGFSPGTPYIGFFETKVNAANRILVMASVDDPAISSSVDRGLVVVQVDAAGALISETVLHKEGDLLPGQTETIADFGTGPHAFDFNETDQVLYLADLNGPTNLDGAVYLDNLLLGQEGSPSPVAGRNWSSLSTSQRVALGNGGDYVYTGTLDGTTTDNSVIIKNNALFRQEGDSLPAFAPFLLTSFGTGPVDIDETGNVLWFGDWDDPDTSKDTGLFLNGSLLVQEGVTQVGGLVVESLSGVQDGYALAPNGDYVIFEATLAGGLNGAFLMDLTGCGLPVTYCTASTTSIAGCVASIGSSGTPSLGNPTGFSMTSGPVPGANVGLMYFSANGRAAIPFGTQGGLICVQFPGFRSKPTTSGGTKNVCDGQYSFTLQSLIATGPSIIQVGTTINAAMWFRDPSSPDTYALSDGIEFPICP